MSKCFQYPPGVIPEQTSKSFYSPVRSDDFFRLVFILSHFKPETVESLNSKPILELYEAVTSNEHALLQDILKHCGNYCFENHNSASTNVPSNKETKQESLSSSSSKPENSKSDNDNIYTEIMDQLRKCAEFWNENKYVYPHCDFNEINLGKQHCEGNYLYDIYRGSRRRRFSFWSNPIQIPEKFFFALLNKKHSVYMKTDGIIDVVDLDELWFKYFAELHECKYIHLRSYLVTGPTSCNDTGSNIKGFITREITSDLDEFVRHHKDDIDPFILLRELLHIAEAINFMHKKNIAHHSVSEQNILVFPEKNGEFSLQLSGLHNCRSFNCMNVKTIGTKNKYEFEYYLKEDWKQFATLMKDSLENVCWTQGIFPDMEELIRYLTDKKYWEDDNKAYEMVQFFISEAIKKHNDKKKNWSSNSFFPKLI